MKKQRHATERLRICTFFGAKKYIHSFAGDFGLCLTFFRINRIPTNYSKSVINHSHLSIKNITYPTCFTRIRVTMISSQRGPGTGYLKLSRRIGGAGKEQLKPCLQQSRTKKAYPHGSQRERHSSHPLNGGKAKPGGDRIMQADGKNTN